MDNTLKILIIGLFASLFFSSTFILNKYIAIEQGHWFWSASLRYIYMIIILVFGFYFFKGKVYLKELGKEFIENYTFWIFTGSIGFGIFYAPICYVADKSPAWVVASTWQFTIIASLFVLSFFGKKISKRTWIFVILLFIGITLINIDELNYDEMQTQLFAIFLIIVASFAYPIGNQRVWELSNNKDLEISRKKIIDNSFSKLFLLSLGSFPFWILLSFLFDIGVPSTSQFVSIFFVALFSGIIATTLFLLARKKANSPSKLALADSTQSSEVIFTLLIEVLFLGALIPSLIGLIGIGVVLVSLAMLALV